MLESASFTVAENQTVFIMHSRFGCDFSGHAPGGWIQILYGTLPAHTCAIGMCSRDGMISMESMQTGRPKLGHAEERTHKTREKSRSYADRDVSANAGRTRPASAVDISCRKSRTRSDFIKARKQTQLWAIRASSSSLHSQFPDFSLDSRVSTRNRSVSDNCRSGSRRMRLLSSSNCSH